MYLRTISRRNKDGSVVRYLQLAQNYWDPVGRQAKAQVVHSFGREDQLDRQALIRLARSITRLVEPGMGVGEGGSGELVFSESRSMGGALVLDHLWQQMGIDKSIKRLLSGRKLDPRVERVLFALVANRALEPLSKLAATQWVGERVFIPGLSEVDDDSCYRAMDFLLECEEELARAVYFSTAELLKLEVDLIFFDGSATYWEKDGADPAWVASHYAGRWSIECVNREVKQVIGAEDPQCWKHKGPERAASLSLWLHAAIWAWYIPTYGTTPSWIPRPW